MNKCDFKLYLPRKYCILNFMKRFLICNLIVAIFALCGAGFLQASFLDSYVDAASSGQANFTNLIVFARFKDESEFINDSCGDISVKQLVDNSYSSTEHSVKDYYGRVSNGKVNMQNLYLFGQDGGSLELSNLRGYYYENKDGNDIGYTSSEYELRLNALKQDWADAILAAINGGCKISNLERTVNYSIDDLDKNGDGKIDSITLLFKYSNEFGGAWKGCLWNYQTYSNMVELSGSGGKVITSNAYVQISYDYTNYYTVGTSEVKIANLKTMIHEMGHIFGLKDLYNSSSDSPVWYMSAMAVAISHIPQYISAKEREALGWFEPSNVGSINSAGTYSINVTSSEAASGIVCYKCEVPSLDKILYLEYRKFDGTTNKYDSMNRQIYDKNGTLIKNISIKSGLVCFLVDSDTLFPNNMNCNQYTWNYKVLGGNYNTKTDAALTTGDSLAISSNLSIQVESVTDNQLSFKVVGTDIAGTHTHSLDKIEYKAPTCTSLGNIEYYKCSSCGKYFLENGTEISLASTVIDYKPHSLVLIPSTTSTCTKKGNIEYYKCSVCGKCFLGNGTEISFADTLLELASHSPETIAGKAPSCTETGLTDGSKCSTCGEILQAQTSIPKIAHTASDWIVDKQPTTTETGSKHKECTVCKQVLDTQSIPINEDETPTQPDNPDPPTQPDDPTTSPDNPSDTNGAASNSSSSSKASGAIGLACILLGITGVIAAPSLIIWVKRRRRW